MKKVTPSTISEVWEEDRQWCKPLPLTEDWLLRFGFEHFDYRDRFQKTADNGYSVCIEDTGIGYRLYEILGNGLEIKTVHQLQNLYFSLCGTELIPQVRQ